MLWLAGIIAAYFFMRSAVAVTCLALFAALLVASSVYSAWHVKGEVAYWLTGILGGLGLCLVVRVIGHSVDPQPEHFAEFVYDWLDSWPVLVGFWGSIICAFLSRSDQPNARALSGASWAFLMAAAYSFYLYRH